jgi:hypothetical protein
MDFYKLFHITGKGYVMIINDMIYGMDIDMNGLYVMQLQQNEMLPYGLVIANSTEFISNEYYYDARVYNMFIRYVNKYTNPNMVFVPLDDTYIDDVRAMKSSNKSLMKTFHDQNNIKTEYLLPIFYGMYPVVKADSVENCICTNGNEYIVKTIVHKKKQKRDIFIYRRFINVDNRYKDNIIM